MKNFAIEIKWSLQLSILTIVWMILEKTFGLHDIHIDKQLIYTNLFALIAVPIYILAMIDKKKNFYKGNMDWKQGFISGAIISIAIAVLSPVVNYIIYNCITPDFFNHMIAYRIANHFQTEIQAKSYFNLHSYIMLGIFDALSKGILTAAIIAHFIKTKNDTHEK